MQVERCSDREHHCQEDGCKAPVEFLLTWPSQATLYLCKEHRDKYQEDSEHPAAETATNTKKKGKHKKTEEETPDE